MMKWSLTAVAGLLIVCCGMHFTRTTALKSYLTPSGKLLPISAILRHQPSLSIKDLPHRVFEYQMNGSLISRHTHIQIHSITQDNSNFHNSEYSTHLFGKSGVSVSSDRKIALRQGRGYTFVFEAHSGVLIAAWGPALQLRAIDPSRYPTMFLNVAVSSSPTILYGFNADQAAHSISKVLAQGANYLSAKQINDRAQCDRRYPLYVAATYDPEFLKSRGGEHERAQSAIEALLYQVGQMFADFTCIFMNIAVIPGDEATYSPVLEKGCTGADRDSVCFRNARRMLNFTQATLADPFKFNYTQLKHSARFLFTAPTDDSPLSGAAYRYTACSSDLSIGWVKGTNPALLAHELGHMLGAQHDEVGVMTDFVQPDQELVLSRESVAYINRFISEDPRSWCLRRGTEVNDGGVDKEWFYGAPILNAPKRNWSMTTTLPFEKDGTPKIFAMAYEITNSSKGLSIDAAVIDFPEIPCRSDPGVNSCWNILYNLKFNLRDKLIPVGMSIAAGRIRNMTSNDFVFSYLSTYNKTAFAFYRVGFGFQPGARTAEQWSTFYEIEPLKSDVPLWSDITVGYVRGGSSPDLVYAQVDRRYLGTIIVYYLGFDLGPDGKVQGGWTDEIKIPSWYELEITSLSVELVDLDNNGRPELIVASTDFSASGATPWIRVGRDLNIYGHATNGWTDYMHGYNPHVKSKQNRGAMTLIKLGDSQITPLFLQRDNTMVHLTYRKNVFTPAYLNTGQPDPKPTELEDGCKTCYYGEYEPYCIRQLQVCAVFIDQVKVLGTTQAPGSTSRQQGRLHEADAARSLLSRKSSSYPQSIYCVGFRYLTEWKRSCETFDRGTVMAIGLELAFYSHFRENRPLYKEYFSTSLFENPAGVNGDDRKSVAVLIIISGKQNTYQSAVKHALGELQRRAGMDYFNVQKRLVRYQKKEDKYFIRFIFKKGLRNHI